MRFYQSINVRTNIGILLAILFLWVPAAQAEWLQWNDSIWNNKKTWVYRPGVSEQKLLVVLHGCKQTGEILKSYGNLASAAEAEGFTVVVPTVDYNGNWGFDCWAYDYGLLGSQYQVTHNVDRIIGLTVDAIQKYPDISRRHVYIAGLSSGGALSLMLGCVRPDLYAGVAAIAGPSIGSLQGEAGAEAKNISEINAVNARNNCLSLAGANANSLQHQIANIAFGTMDKPAKEDKYRQDRHTPCPWQGWWPFTRWWCDSEEFPGQYEVVSIQYSLDNVAALAEIYGVFRDDERIISSRSDVEEVTWRKAGVAVLTRLAIPNVGHAWPAGDGRENGVGGYWIASQGFNYSAYIMRWFAKNNRTPIVAPAEELPLTAAP